MAGLLLTLGFLLSACSTSYQVDVDAIRNPHVGASGFSYRIEATDPAKTGSDPDYDHVMELVRAALSGRGLYEAPDGETPSIIIEVDYGVGPARTRIVRNANREMLGNDTIGPVDPRMSTIGSDPRRVTIGSSPISRDAAYREEFVFEKYLTIVARDGSSDPGTGQPRVELWRVHVSVEDNSENVSGYLAVLAGAAADYIGADTQEKQRLRMSENDEVVDFVKEGL